MSVLQPRWAKSYRFGVDTLYAFERPDRAGHVYVRFDDRSVTSHDRRRKTRLSDGIQVRDEKGRISKVLVAEVDQHVHALATKLLLGEPLRPADKLAPLTLTQGFDLVLDLHHGKYPERTRRWDAVSASAKQLVQRLGGNRPWEEITPPVIRALWREEAKQSRGENLRRTEVMIDALLSVGHWLMQEEKLPTRLMAPKNWRRILKDEWRRITNVTPSLRQPRYEEAEWTRLQAALDDPRLDPRMRLAFTLGAHARLGQVIRCHRVDLDLPALTGDETDDSFFGELRVPGDGKKRGTRIRLSPAERRAVDTAMAGYLRDYERARIAGHRSNYPLFPAGRLRAGRAKQADDTQPITRDGARGLFVALEQIAGVTHVPGRGWYGARRFAADIAEDYEQDERALNQLTGHSDSTMRRHYQNLKRDETARKAAKVRDQLRGHGVVAVHNASGDADGT